MIDIEAIVFTPIAAALREAYDPIYVTMEYVPAAPTLPAVIIRETSNAIYEQASTNATMEYAAEVTLEVDVYSGLRQGKRAQAREIMSVVDGMLAGCGWTRFFLNPVQNLNDPNIYRMTARYRAIVTQDNVIHRR